ncbi:TauD/TfdA family dioxygenase [Streptomyces sp. PTM05]|uniref:TauD/TfdA family dioxygenase n=1 Tax=Streptantibioticus parmotrematis TaxID=2873249 RepID=A0ABS7QUY2_9ACTN|nr:TauD/TfdA family dioxygenase [Streptantibioticus parmotrematis]MBY8887020.1 TauD/TfdA family dioxygenase [Streptantibioticus parmotrematis]
MSTLIEVGDHRFHPLWLRDNCLCPECREPASFQKLLDLGRLPGLPTARRWEVTDGTLVVDWVGTPEHRSVFPLEWLSVHAHDQPASRGDKSMEPWDATTWLTSPPAWHEIQDCDPEGGPWADDLVRFGIAFLANVTSEELDAFATKVGPPFVTEFGRVVAVEAVRDADDLALSGAELSVHTDFSAHMHSPPLLQFMLCEAQDPGGGESVFVDGFQVAERFRSKNPRYFEMLVRTPINFQQFYGDHHLFHQRRRPVLELGEDGSVSGVFFGHSHACNWRIAPDDVELYYAAYHAFFGCLKNPANQLRLQLEAGQCVLLRNGRLLHGRGAYDPRAGRKLITQWTSWEYFASRRRYHRYKHLYQ